MRILIISGNRYPQGDAGAVREEVFAKMFESLGHDVRVAGLGTSTYFAKKQHSGIPYYSLRSEKESIVSRIINRAAFFHRLCKYVLDNEEQFDYFMTSDISLATLKRLKRYARRDSIGLIHNSVEWYSPDEFRLGKVSRNYRENDLINRVEIDQSIKVIAISSYLEKYYRNKKISTIRIPVVFDLEEFSIEKTVSEEKVIFLYAGSPGKKDYLAEIVSSFSFLTEQERMLCEFRIIGITEEQLYNNCGVDLSLKSTLGATVKCYGRLPRSEVLTQLSQADFTLLLREPDKRYAKAGFPTKFSESMATGTPVISNLSSDLSMYLQDGINGFVCDTCSAESMSKSIRKALELSFEGRRDMQRAAERTANSFFDYRIYKEQMGLLLTQR